MTLIVNTSLSIGPWFKDENLKDPTEKWTLVNLGLRAVDILENQVYQLSVANVFEQADALRFAYLGNRNIPDGEQPQTAMDKCPTGVIVYRGKTCGGWYIADKDKSHPIEFYPRYMACLIDYGRWRGLQGQWNQE